MTDLQKLFVNIYQELEATNERIVALSLIVEQNALQLARLLKVLEPMECQHQFKKRMDVIYFTFPIQYQYQCVKCGLERTGK